MYNKHTKILLAFQICTVRIRKTYIFGGHVIINSGSYQMLTFYEIVTDEQSTKTIEKREYKETEP